MGGQEQGEPTSPTCRYCAGPRLVIKVVGGFSHRLCPKCDSREDGVKSSWDRS